MSRAAADLPEDPVELRSFAEALAAEVHAKTLLIEKLKMQLAVLRRARFGRSSEKLDRDIEQLELLIGDMEESEAERGAARREQSAPVLAELRAFLDATLSEVSRITGPAPQTFWARTEVTRAGVSALAGSAALVAANKTLSMAEDMYGRMKETYRSYDDLVRTQRVVMSIDKEQQAPLIKQAIEMGGPTKYNDLQVLEAQLGLAKRGVKAEMVPALTQRAADFGQAMNVDLPTAAKTLESALFSTAQSMESAADALKSSQHVVDLMVKTAKISGMESEDLGAFYKFGGAPGHSAGLSLETMGAMMSRAGIRGDEAGVAVRSISGSLVSPTTKGMIALNAMGIDFSKYADMSKRMTPENLEIATKRELGVEFDAHAARAYQGDYGELGDRRQSGGLRQCDRRRVSRSIEARSQADGANSQAILEVFRRRCRQRAPPARHHRRQTLGRSSQPSFHETAGRSFPGHGSAGLGAI